MAWAFGGGVLASLSPCVYPLIPITLGYFGSQTDVGGARFARIALYGLGQIVGFVLIGFLAVRLGEIFGFTSESRWLNLVVGLGLLAFGIVSVQGRLPGVFDRWNQWNHRFLSNFSHGKFSAFILGLSSAFVASPCTTPILSGVLAMLATQQEATVGFFAMISYSLGFSGLFLALGFGLLRLSKLPRAGLWMKRIHSVSTGLLILAGGYFTWKGLFPI
jgi:thiol:disulfide interchange protein DsbD